MGVVTCGGCGLRFDRVAEKGEFIKSKWYHKGCAEIKRDKMELDAYICKLFNLKAPGPLNNSLVKKYKEQMGYNYKGIRNALKYFYEIKKNTVNKAEERVGIVPYIYTEAQEYFRTMEEIARRNNKTIEKTKEEISITLCPAQPIKEIKNDTSELDSLFEE